jgi:hypothetical protein
MAARSAALLVLHAAACEAAGGKGELQSTSSATIGIRLSVAAQYRLRPIAPSARGAVRAVDGPGGYWIASNTAPMVLPILLIGPGPAGARLLAAQGASGSPPPSAVPIGPCDAAGASPAGPARQGLVPHAGLLMIRPE